MNNENLLDPVRLIEFKQDFNEIIPGVEIVEHISTQSLGAIWSIRMEFAKHQLMAISSEHAKQRIRVFAEQMRHRAIRELGLEPILEGMRQEVHQFKHQNTTLANLVSSQEKRIATLVQALNVLEHPEDYENEN